MPDKLIKDLTALTDGQVNDDTKYLPFGNNTTGEAFKGTIAQLKLVMQTKNFTYTTLGSEGTTLTIPTIAGMYIVALFREGSLIYPVVSAPDSVQYIWDTANITLGLTVNPIGGERFYIEYRAI